MQELRSLSDDLLAQPSAAALWGKPAIDAELERRSHREVVDLRGEDAPRDPWLAEKSRLGHLFDPVAASGLRAASATYGDAFEREAARREGVRRREKQRAQYEVAIGAVIILRNGTQLGEGAALTAELVAHPHAAEVMQRLVALGYLSEIDAHVAWLRGLEPSVGPFVVVIDSLQVGARTLRRGQGVSEADFPALERARPLTDETRLADLTVRDIRRLMREEINPRVPRRFDAPPPMSPFERALSSHRIERAPNYIRPEERKAKK